MRTVKFRKPEALFGHSAVVDSKGFMYLFGGDNNYSAFNELVMIDLTAIEIRQESAAPVTRH